MKAFIYALAVTAAAQWAAAADNGSFRPSDWVNPFIGASTSVGEAGVYHGLGKTFPGAATPFGMVQLSPNTITGGDNGPGYSYEHTTIEGFAFTQMSGIGWYGDLGNLLTMPTTGPLHTGAGAADRPEDGYRSRYDKSSETASAAYYAVNLTDYGIRAEATAAPRSGMLRFTYPATDTARIQIDLARRVGGTSTLQEVHITGPNSIEGRMVCTPEGGGWGNGGGQANYTVYFHAEFSKPFERYGVWSADIPEGRSRRLGDIESTEYKRYAAEARVMPGIKDFEGKHIGFYTEFPTAEGEQVLMKAGISFVDTDGARRNLEADMPDWDFDAVRERSRSLWDDALSRITIDTDNDEYRTVFYTALYHTMIDPRLMADCDGRYPGGDGRIHQTGSWDKRTIFSGWDVFRSQMPLQTLINPKVVNDMLCSLISLADESGRGYFERWELLNAYSGCMLGNPAVSVLADAYFKGIRGYDPEQAYRIAAATCERWGNGDRGYSTGNNGISLTLEHAYAEWCMMRLAKALGHDEDVAKYARRSMSYRNIYDRDKHSFRPRGDDGQYLPWPREGRLREGYGCMESNPWQQGWFVPHDVEGMTNLMGGLEATVADLDTFFARTPEHFLWNPYYNHANEPVHHVVYLYNRLGQPHKTQRWSRFICENAYHNKVAGLTGNEDVGQMSAWYVLSSIGLHPLCPGDTRLEITSPLFDCAEINLPDGGKFTIVAKDNGPGRVYIKSARLNGRPYPLRHIDHKTVSAGGILELTMSDTPD